jgi:hypothetical protein
VGLRVVPLAEPPAARAGVGAGDVEVPQAHGADPVHPGMLGQRRVHGELGLAIGVAGPCRCALVDGDALRFPVHGGGGGEDDPPGPGGPHGLEQGERAAEIVPPVQRRAGHRLGHQRLRREVQDRVGSPARAGEHLPRVIPDGPLDEGHPGGHRVRVTGGQVVQDDHVVP